MLIFTDPTPPLPQKVYVLYTDENVDIFMDGAPYIVHCRMVIAVIKSPPTLIIL